MTYTRTDPITLPCSLARAGNYLKEMTEVLRKKKIIELSLNNEVNDLQSRELPDTKAKVVYQRLQAMVQQDKQSYCGFSSEVPRIRENS